MYQALYRKWRPQTFSQVVGQRHITDTLRAQVRSGRLSHAYLFIGTRGTGKTTCARILAKAVNCEHPVDGEPCCQCPACLSIAQGSAMDVVEMDAASNNGVDNVRAMREEAVFSPGQLKKRVYIIDEVHMLSPGAFNALLKILEEPPEHLMFILATTELQKMPATILSRCQRHSFRRIGTAEIAAYLGKVAQAEGMDLAADAAQAIARLAEGGLRDAMSLLDQCSARDRIDLEAVWSAMGLAGQRQIGELLRLVLDRDCAGALGLFRRLWMDGKDPAGLLGELSALVRDILMIKIAPKGGGELLSGNYDQKELEAFARKLTGNELIAMLDTLQARAAAMRDAKDPRIGAELCLAQLCLEPGGESPAGLNARISRLEEAVAHGIPAAPAPAPAPTREERVEAPPPPPRYEEREREDLPWEERPPVPTEEDEPPEADDIEIGAYQEEQPEDSFLQGRQKTAAQAALKQDQGVELARLWDELTHKYIGQLPMDIQVQIMEDKTIRPRLKGDLLEIRMEPSFRSERLKRSSSIQKLQALASQAAGRPLTVKVTELKAGSSGPQRDLEELKRFKEVRFVND